MTPVLWEMEKLYKITVQVSQMGPLKRAAVSENKLWVFFKSHCGCVDTTEKSPFQSYVQVISHQITHARNSL